MLMVTCCFIYPELCAFLMWRERTAPGNCSRHCICKWLCKAECCTSEVLRELSSGVSSVAAGGAWRGRWWWWRSTRACWRCRPTPRWRTASGAGASTTPSRCPLVMSPMSAVQCFLQRAVTRRKLVPVTKTENVTRVVSVPGCCEDRPHSGRSLHNNYILSQHI